MSAVLITTAPRPRPSRLLVLALLASLLIHLFGGSLWGLFARVLTKILPAPTLLASRRDVAAEKTDLIRFERPAKAAAPPQAHENKPVPHRAIAQPVPQPVPVAVPPPTHREIAHITVRAPRQYAPAQRQGQAEVPQPLAPAQSRKPAFSDEQIAQLGAQFSKTIADSHQNAQSITAATQHAPVTIKHYEIPFSGIHEGINPGDGYIRPISQQRIGDTMWYYTHYTYMYGDGHIEDDDIPWPFHYPVNDDPFARHDKRIALQAPPSGYTPDRALKPQLMQFFGGPEVK